MSKQEQVTILQESLKRLQNMASDSTQDSSIRLNAEAQIAAALLLMTERYGF